MKITLDGKTREMELANLRLDRETGCFRADIIHFPPDNQPFKVIGSVEFDEDETDVMRELMR